MNLRIRTAGFALTALAPLAACGGGHSDDESTLTVLAAASLTETFTALADEFESQHEGATVELALDSSATLSQQAVDGAPGDVLATADEATMQSAVDGGAVAEGPETFATNVAVLVTPPDNPAGIITVDDLDGDVTYVVCVDTAPCGKIAATLLDQGGITAEPASLEVDVKAVLAKVTGDEADAGIVYATDAVAAGDAVTVIDIEGADAERTVYPIATLEQSEDEQLAGEFMDLVLSDEGQQVLADAGFGGPA
ncbi:MAG: molybdate ABC transporter substrate-binding protein [Nocardioides sp.]